jgi:hypothetical protein
MPVAETAAYIRRLMRHPKFNTRARCNDVFLYPVGAPEAAILHFLQNYKRPDNRLIATILFSLIKLHKELSKTDATWVFELPCLLVNDRKTEAIKLLKRIQETKKDLPEWKNRFYFNLLLNELDPPEAKPDSPESVTKE